MSVVGPSIVAARRRLVLAGAFGLLVAAPLAASADEFDDRARAADPVPTREGLAAELWPAAGTCSAGEPFEQRQCDVVRRARRASRADTALLVAGDAASVEVGAFDDKRRSVPVRVRPCIACEAPVAVGDSSLFVVGRGAVTARGDGLVVPVMHEGSVVFPDRAAADEWIRGVAPRLRVEFVVALPVDEAPWSESARRGVRVRVDGFRVYDPCTGVVVAAAPAAARLAGDRRACGEVGQRAPADPSLPVAHTAFAINRAMAPARAAARECLETHGETGTAKLTVTVSGDGAVVAVSVSGELAGSPTDACLAKAVKALRFPRIQRETMTFRYPVEVR